MRGLLIAFGDSYTEGYGARPSEAYPARLEAMLSRTVVNRGVSGETAAEAARRLDREVIRQHPDLVIVEFGVNEAFRGVPIERCLEDLDRMVRQIRGETAASVILLGVHFWDYQARFDDGLRALAKAHGAGLVLGVLDGIVSTKRDRDDGNAALRSDRFHPNAAGYQLMADRVAPEAKRMLSRRE